MWYVTGSNSKFLSSDIVTEFRGRGDEIRNLSPLFCRVFILSIKVIYDDAWDDYMTYGGLPQVVGFTERTTEGRLPEKISFANVYI